MIIKKIILKYRTSSQLKLIQQISQQESNWKGLTQILLENPDIEYIIEIQEEKLMNLIEEYFVFLKTSSDSELVIRRIDVVNHMIQLVILKSKQYFNLNKINDNLSTISIVLNQKNNIFYEKFSESFIQYIFKKAQIFLSNYGLALECKIGFRGSTLIINKERYDDFLTIQSYSKNDKTKDNKEQVVNQKLTEIMSIISKLVQIEENNIFQENFKSPIEEKMYE